MNDNILPHFVEIFLLFFRHLTKVTIGIWEIYI